MKTPLTIFFFFIALICSAQDKTKELADAENAFAKWAIEHNTREAFLRFMDTSAVVFDKGEVQKAKATWEAKTINTNKLFWYPTFAVISTGGDLGITTGPWEMKATANAKDTALATGAFMTVWTKKNNEWKWNVDIGITNNLKIPRTTGVSSVELNHIERTTYDGLRYMLMAEQNFISAYNSIGKDAYANVADNDIHFLNPNQLPVHGIYSIDAALVNMSGKIQFQATGSGCSTDGDLGYVYGIATENGKKGNYLRVWRRISRKWMLMMQTLTI